MLENIRPLHNTNVVELEQESLRLIAALLHSFVNDVEEECVEKSQAVLTIEHLNHQTECVSLIAIDHKIRATRKPQMDITGLIIPDNIGQMAWSTQLQIVGNI